MLRIAMLRMSRGRGFRDDVRVFVTINNYVTPLVMNRYPSDADYLRGKLYENREKLASVSYEAHTRTPGVEFPDEG